MHTPTWPVNFAWPHAMNAADSSWRGWMNCILPSERSIAPIRPLMPSPG
jgi:hypothetical protein